MVASELHLLVKILLFLCAEQGLHLGRQSLKWCGENKIFKGTVMTKQKFLNNLLEDYEKLNLHAEYFFCLSKGAMKDDRLALIIVYAAAETILDFLLKAFCKHSSTISGIHTPFMAKVILLNEIGVIDEKLFNNLNNLKQLRHSVAHNPAVNIEWKGKFAFNKKSGIYKKFVDNYGKPLQDLVDNIFCVWNDLYMAGTRACTRKHLKQMENTKDEQKQ